LTAPDGHPGSYAFLAVASPDTRSGVVSGWLSHDRGSGVVFSEIADEAVRMLPQIDYGRLRIHSGQSAESEIFVVGWFDDARLGLEQYAQTSMATPDNVQRLNNVLGEKWPRFPYRLDFDVSDLPSLLNMTMKSPLWNELGERCLACAACTNVCPTCFCFDVRDEIELNLRHGQRVRVWDSCQLDEFATVAGGHNFRTSRALRQRHRFMRKGKYILDAHDYLGCVGCGRCARACLVDITPVGVFNELHRQLEVEGRL
jgi:formate hydrogenlyase subunit 6/NADH:ubiquinone oxidoreductase subunit I